MNILKQEKKLNHVIFNWRKCTDLCLKAYLILQIWPFSNIVFTVQVLKFSLWCNWGFSCLRCDATLLGECFLMFQRNLLHFCGPVYQKWLFLVHLTLENGGNLLCWTILSLKSEILTVNTVFSVWYLLQITFLLFW